MFKNEGKDNWLHRLSWKGRTKPEVFGLGSEDERATGMMEMLKRFKRERKFVWLDELAADKSREKLNDAYDADVLGNVGGYFASLAEAKTEAEVDPDLDPMVDEWAKGANLKQVRQVRCFIPKGKRFPLSNFRRKTIKVWLDSRAPISRVEKLSLATRTRYKNAISNFAKYLLNLELLEANPTIELEIQEDDLQKAERLSRVLEYREEAVNRKLVESLEEGALGLRSYAALMAGSGCEKQAADRATPEDFDFVQRRFHAKGTKVDGTKGPRYRKIQITEDWAFELVKARVEATPPGQLVWRIKDKVAEEAHHTAQEALGLPRFTLPLHSHRHSFAVMWIKRGILGVLKINGKPYDKQWLKRQLGHDPKSMMIDTTYAFYINDWMDQHEQPELVRSVSGQLRQPRLRLEA